MNKLHIMGLFSFTNILSVSGSICTILSALYTIYKMFKKTRLGQRVQGTKWLYSMVLAMTLFSIFSSFYLLVDSNSPSRVLRLFWMISLMVGLGVLLWYVHNAIKSLDREPEINIWPPKMLWQMLINKVPSVIPDVEDKGNLFAVVSMDDSKKVKDAEVIIKNNYQENIEYITGYEKNNYSLADLNSKEDIRGVLFLVGPSSASKLKELKETIAEYADSHKVNPIACYWSVGGKEYNLPYQQILHENLCVFVKCLATRAYYRNYMQIRLGHAYQKTFLVQGLLILLFFIGLICLGPRLNEMWKEYNAKKMEIEEMRDSLSFYRSPLGLKNRIDVELNKEFSIRRLNLDIVETLENFTHYYFSDLNNLCGVKLWYDDDSLVRVINTDKLDNSKKVIRRDEREKYMSDFVLKHKMFVLWPGEDNINSSIDSIDMVWRNDENTNVVVKGSICKDKSHNYYWKGNIDGEKEDTIRWFSDGNDKQKAMLLFSYDGRLVLEVFFSPKSFKDNYKYMSHKVFRDSVRKYIRIVTLILNCYCNKPKDCLSERDVADDLI